METTLDFGDWLKMVIHVAKQEWGDNSVNVTKLLALPHHELEDAWRSGISPQRFAYTELERMEGHGPKNTAS